MVRPLTLFILFFCLLGTLGYSQQAKNTYLKKSQKNRGLRAPIVSRYKARIICPIFQNSQYPYQGIGIKVGDPAVITYKFYPNKHWSFAADAGKVASGLYSKYYRKAFYEYIPDTLAQEQSIGYLSHQALTDWYLEAKFLYQWNAEKISPGLQLYAGLGWQWRSTQLDYDYVFQDDENNPFGENRIGKFRESRFSYGPVAIVGFEYSYFSLPLSAFIEIEWYTDALLDPGYKRFQGGVGLRYIF